MVALYFGPFSMEPQDAALGRQALFKLSFLHRHFLKPAGLGLAMRREAAHFSGRLPNGWLMEMAVLLARQIGGIERIVDETESRPAQTKAADAAERDRLILATENPRRKDRATRIDMDDESLEALILFRLKLVPETAAAALKVKAERGVATLTGKVATAGVRAQVEKVARATLGLGELRLDVAVG
jgi:hypothetical protein